jgi:hypothetical protein
METDENAILLVLRAIKATMVSPNAAKNFSQTARFWPKDIPLESEPSC